MVDVFAHPDSRAAFLAETEQLAARDDADDGVVALRKLVADEPLAILYCVDGSYVKASPTILKTSNGTDDTPASVQMREMLQNSYRDHLAHNRGDDIKPKHFGAVEVRRRVGACVGALVTCFVCLHRIWGSSRLPPTARSCFSTGRRLLTFPGRMQVCFPSVVVVVVVFVDCPTLLLMLLTICVLLQPAGRSLWISMPTA